MSVIDPNFHEQRARILVSVISQLFMVCASVLFFFAHLSLPQTLSASAALAAMFACSLLIWQSFNGAKLVLLLSLVAIQLVLLPNSPMLLVPFALLDIAALALIAFSWSSRKD